MPVRSTARTWRRFRRDDCYAIEAQLASGGEARCPGCGGPLTQRHGTRLAAVLPRGVRGFDVDCRPCRRFHAFVQHSPQSLYVLRIQRLAAAVMRA